MGSFVFSVVDKKNGGPFYYKRKRFSVVSVDVPLCGNGEYSQAEAENNVRYKFSMMLFNRPMPWDKLPIAVELLKAPKNPTKSETVVERRRDYQPLLPGFGRNAIYL